MNINEKRNKAQKLLNSNYLKKVLNKFYHSKEKKIDNINLRGILKATEFKDLSFAIYYNNYPNIEEDMEAMEELVKFEDILLIKKMYKSNIHTIIKKNEDFDKKILNKKIKEF